MKARRALPLWGATSCGGGRGWELRRTRSWGLARRAHSYLHTLWIWIFRDMWTQSANQGRVPAELDVAGRGGESRTSALTPRTSLNLSTALSNFFAAIILLQIG